MTVLYSCVSLQVNDVELTFKGIRFRTEIDNKSVAIYHDFEDVLVPEELTGEIGIAPALGGLSQNPQTMRPADDIEW